MTAIRTFWNQEDGQGLVEYTLLITLLAVMSAVGCLHAVASISCKWVTVETYLSAAPKTARPALQPQAIW